MDPFSRAYAEIDLALLHYITFIDSLMESLFFGSERFYKQLHQQVD
jgi:hypothetical protein